jgi:uncharacterized protein involved in exopolysaccharide biosynthesis
MKNNGVPSWAVIAGIIGGFGGGALALIIFTAAMSVISEVPNPQTSTLSDIQEGPSLQIYQFIDAVQANLAKAQADDPKGPLFLVKDFDLEIHVQESDELKTEMGVETAALLKVASTRSEGKTHLVRLHFTSAAYDLAQRVIEECAKKYLSLTGTQGSELNPMLLQAKLSQKDSFIDCINENLPESLRPMSTIVGQTIELMFGQNNK